MPATGYPDYQRVTFDAGNQFYNANKPFTAAGYIMPYTPCSNWESISVFCQTQTGSDFYTVYCVFVSDLNNPIIVAQPSFIMGPNFRAIKSIPVEGPYFALYIDVKAGANNTPVQVTAYGGAANLSAMTWDFFGTTVYDASYTLATNASNLDSGVSGTHGLATVAFDTSNTKNFRCAILYYRWDLSGYKNLYLFYGADIGRGGIVRVDLPLSPLQFYIQNTDPASQTVSMRVTPAAAGIS